MPTNIEIIEDLKLGDLSVEDQNQLIAQITETLQNRVAMRVEDSLSDEEKEEFDNLLTAGDQDKVDQYLEEKVPALNSIVSDEYDKLRRELVVRNEAITEAFEKAADKVK